MLSYAVGGVKPTTKVKISLIINAIIPIATMPSNDMRIDNQTSFLEGFFVRRAILMKSDLIFLNSTMKILSVN
jgi:hypothetical protein